MNLNTVCSNLLTFTKVVVTGPQRAGTTIATKILANALKLTCRLEESFHTFDVPAFFRLLDREDFITVQAPTMASLVHYLPDDVAIVFMRRNVQDIIRSQERIDWSSECADIERMRYFQLAETPPALIKYHFWDTYQRHLIGVRGFDLDYESLRQHPFWRDQEDRRHFHSRQTE